MSERHPIREVQIAERHAALFLAARDVERDAETRNPLPDSLTEPYLLNLLRARAVPAIDAVIAWASVNLGRPLPDVVLDHLRRARTALRGLKSAKATSELRDAGRLLISALPRGLCLRDAARFAFLSSTLTTLTTVVSARTAADLKLQCTSTWELAQKGVLTERDTLGSLLKVWQRYQGLRPFEDLKSKRVRESVSVIEEDHYPHVAYLLWAIEGDYMARLCASDDAELRILFRRQRRA